MKWYTKYVKQLESRSKIRLLRTILRCSGEARELYATKGTNAKGLNYMILKHTYRIPRLTEGGHRV